MPQSRPSGKTWAAATSKFVDFKLLVVDNRGMAFQPEAAFEEMARGDAGAREFLNAFYVWAHTLDDLIDQDKPVGPDLAVWTQTHLMFVLAGNPFFQKHQAFLLPVILTSALAFLASEARKNRPDVLDRITAQVLKSQYLDVFLAAAFCIGGWDHAAAMSAKYRDYSFDAEPVNVG